MQVGFRQRQKLPERSRMSNNAQHRALWTMSSKPLPAPVALTARQVDFPYHSTRQKVRIIRLHDFADEFMPRRSGEAVVTTLKLKVGVADPPA